METIVVEYNGAMRQVTLEQLSALVRRGFVSPDARAIVDGEDCLVREQAGAQRRVSGVDRRHADTDGRRRAR